MSLYLQQHSKRHPDRIRHTFDLVKNVTSTADQADPGYAGYRFKARIPDHLRHQRKFSLLLLERATTYGYANDPGMNADGTETYHSELPIDIVQSGAAP